MQEPGSRNDPLYGIPDTNMPGLADIRLARALQTPRQSWRAWRPAGYFLCLVCVLVIAITLFATEFR